MNCAGRAISDTLFGEEDENGEHTTITLDPNATTGTSVASQVTTTGPAPAPAAAPAPAPAPAPEATPAELDWNAVATPADEPGDNPAAENNQTE